MLPRKEKVNRYYFFSKLTEQTNFLKEINPDDIANAYEATKAILHTKLNLIREELKHLHANSQQKAIIVGTEDFFDGASWSHSRFFDLKAVYEMLATEFIALSREFPNVIICPGSMYVSTPIPAAHESIKFAQDNISNQSLAKTVCYSTNLMPVLYNGQLLRIIRKGEKVRLGKASLESIEEIGKSGTPPNAKIKVISYHEDNLTDVSMGTKHATCYLGKTLLPGEANLISEFLNLSSHETLFNHEAAIDGDKFIFVICGEFRADPGFTSTAGEMLEKNFYDYIIHSTVGGDLFDRMIKPESIYIHSDFGGGTKLTIENIDQPLNEKAKKQNENLLVSAYIDDAAAPVRKP